MAETVENKKPKAEKEKKGKADGAKAEPVRKREPHGEPRLRKRYREVVVENLKKRFGMKSVMEVPRLEKIVLNMGVGQATQDSKLLDEAVGSLRAIAGQQPAITKAKKSISNFKLRKGQAIGCMVTLRGHNMYEFFDRLVNIAVPRVRDFRGLSRKSFDGRGNFSMGIREQIIFHEIDTNKVNRIMGLDVAICTNAGTDEKAAALLEEMGMPFRKN
jgi:large subunit ribosomal protein L5